TSAARAGATRRRSGRRDTEGRASRATPVPKAPGPKLAPADGNETAEAVMDTWQFYQNDSGEWCWKHVAENGFTVASDVCFKSRTDCIADAMRHGYLARTAYRHGAGLPWQGSVLTRCS